MSIYINAYEIKGRAVDKFGVWAALKQSVSALNIFPWAAVLGYTMMIVGLIVIAVGSTGQACRRICVDKLRMRKMLWIVFLGTVMLAAIVAIAVVRNVQGPSYVRFVKFHYVFQYALLIAVTIAILSMALQLTGILRDRIRVFHLCDRFVEGLPAWAAVGLAVVGLGALGYLACGQARTGALFGGFCIVMFLSVVTTLRTTKYKAAAGLASHRLRCLAIALILILPTGYSLREFIRIYSTHSAWAGRGAFGAAIDFFAGMTAYADTTVEGRTDFRGCLKLAGQVPYDAAILQVMTASYCTCIPQIAHQFPHAPPDWSDVLYGNSEAAVARLRSAGYDFFYFDVSPHGQYEAHQYSPAFRRDSLIKTFNLVWTSDDEYLLMWKQPNGTPLDTVSADRIHDAIENTREIEHNNSGGYLRHKQIRESGVKW